MRQIYQKLVEYWTLIPPRILEHRKDWNGITITPLQQEKQVLQTIKDEDDVTILSTKKEGRIVRKYGDILSDEEVKNYEK